jgi:hypothetical protein
VFGEPLASNGLPCLFDSAAKCVIEPLLRNGYIRHNIMKVRECGWKRSWNMFGYYTGIYLEGLSKIA